MSQPKKLFTRLITLPFPGREKVLQVFSASFLQVIVMGLNFISSLLILRILDKSQYGLYTIFYTLLAALQLMSNSNLTIGLSTIGGRVWRDKVAFSTLIYTANRLRWSLAVFTIPAVMLYAVGLLYYQDYFGPGELLSYGVFLGLLLIGSFPDLLGLFYSNCLLLVNKFSKYYYAQIIQAGVKIAAAILLFWVVDFGDNSLYVLLALIAIANWAWYVFLRRSVQGVYEPQLAEVDQEMRTELISYPKRTWHNTLFYIFQGQIGLILLALVGTQDSIAELGALGRFAVINTLFLSVAGALFFPQYAKLKDYQQLKKSYFTALGFGVLSGAGLILAAALFPGVFLWLLGPQYANLQVELLLAITMGGLNLLNGIFHGMNNARGWIKYVPKFGIISYLIPFLLGLYLLDVASVKGILQLYVLIELGQLTVEIFSGRAGLRDYRLNSSEQ